MEISEQLWGGPLVIDRPTDKGPISHDYLMGPVVLSSQFFSISNERPPTKFHLGSLPKKKALWLVALSHPSFMPRQWRTRPRKQRRRRISTMLAWSQNQLWGWSNDRRGPPRHIEDVKVLRLDQFKGFFSYLDTHGARLCAGLWNLYLDICMYACTVCICIYFHVSIKMLF